jgi:hypothetical protein
MDSEYLFRLVILFKTNEMRMPKKILYIACSTVVGLYYFAYLTTNL